MKQELIMIANTLDHIEVKGKENISKLLGCIQHLEELIKSIPDEKAGDE